MFKKIINILGGDPHKKEVDRASLIVDQVNGLEAEYEKLSDEALRAKTDEFQARLAEHGPRAAARSTMRWTRSSPRPSPPCARPASAPSACATTTCS